MSEQALPIAIRAEERANAAHQRLDGINGSVNRVNKQLGDIDSKVDSILITLATQQGAEGMKSGLMDSRRFWIGIAAVLATSSVAALLFTLLTRHPSG